MLFGGGLEQRGDVLPYRRVRLVRHVRVRSVEALDQLLHAFAAGEVAHLRLRACRLRPEMDDRLAHGHALPVGPVDFLIAPLRLRPAIDVLRRFGDDFLRDIHDALIVGVGLIGLEHGELGIPAPSQAFVAEVAVDLVDAIESAHHQPLQIKFGAMRR